MTDSQPRPRANEPEDLARLLVERMNAGDIDGLVMLYEPDAVLAIGSGRIASGAAAIRAFFEDLLASRPTFRPGVVRPALRSGGLALTSTRTVGGAVTAEIARQQSNGTWLWVVDQPVIAREPNE